jgi:nucleoside-diphosphate-sugar epimerase
MKRKILVTGGTGFVGKNLINSLRSKYEVISANLRKNSISFYEDDYFGIIHLAGIAHDFSSKFDHDAYDKINFELTRDVYDHFSKRNVAFFLFVSSIKAVGDISINALDENTDASPSTNYGISKLKAENYIVNNSKNLNKSVYIFRPSMIHGEGNKGNLNSLYSLVQAKLPWPLGKFENKRSFCSINNFVFIINEFLENSRKIENGIYHVCDDDSISTNDLIRILGEVSNRKILFLPIPKSVILTLLKICGFLQLSFIPSNFYKLTSNFESSNLKLKKALGKDLPLTTEEGLKITFESFLNKELN